MILFSFESHSRKFLNERKYGNTFRLKLEKLHCCREAGSHDGWSIDQTRDRPTSLFVDFHIIIKKEHVEFVSPSVNN